MYRDNTELRIFTITGTEIADLASKKQDSLRAAVAKLETALPGRDAHEGNYLNVHIREMRGQVDGLEFLKSHVKPGSHDVTVDELAFMRVRLEPVDLDNVNVHPVEPRYEGATLAVNEAAGAKGFGGSGRLW